MIRIIILLFISGSLFGQTKPYDIENNPKTSNYGDSVAVIAVIDTTTGEYGHVVKRLLQVLSISGDTIFLSDGGFIDLTTYGYNIYSRSDTIQGTRTVTLNGNDIDFQGNTGTAGVSIENSGSIVIRGGSTTNAYRLEDAAGNPDRVITANNAGSQIFIGDIDNNSRELRLRSAGADRVTIQADGDVGIGTTVPGYKLHVAGTTGQDPVRITELQEDDAIFDGVGHVGGILHSFDRRTLPSLDYGVQDTALFIMGNTITRGKVVPLPSTTGSTADDYVVAWDSVNMVYYLKMDTTVPVDSILDQTSYIDNVSIVDDSLDFSAFGTGAFLGKVSLTKYLNTNIYTDDGTLAADRTITGNQKGLTYLPGTTGTESIGGRSTYKGLKIGNTSGRDAVKVVLQNNYSNLPNSAAFSYLAPFDLSATHLNYNAFRVSHGSILVDTWRVETDGDMYAAGNTELAGTLTLSDYTGTNHDSIPEYILGLVGGEVTKQAPNDIFPTMTVTDGTTIDFTIDSTLNLTGEVIIPDQDYDLDGTNEADLHEYMEDLRPRGTYKNYVAARSGGVTDGQYFQVTQTNTLGLPTNTVLKLVSTE